MKKHQKGFTLVEILVVIAIIGLLFGIGVPTYSIIVKNIRQKNYENKLSYAITKAEAWASDTGRTATNIAHLIEEGYMEPDDEAGAYNNPVDESSMLCYTIRVEYQDNQYHGELTEERYCEYEELEKQTSIIELVKLDASNSSLISYDSWTKNNVILKVQFKTNEYANLYQNSVTEIIWKGNSQREVIPISQNFNTKNQYSIQVSQFMNTKYEVTMKIIHDGKTYIYKAYTQVKIDRQSPLIYQDEIEVDHYDEWTASDKKIHLVTTDLDGSGVYGYYVNTSKGACSGNKSMYQAVSSSNIDLSLNQGVYYVCVMDNVGNVSEQARINVDKVDKSAPTFNGFQITEQRKGRNYYSLLKLRASYSDNASGVGAIKYCFTTSSSCTPNNMLAINDGSNYVLEFTESKKEGQKICVLGIDKSGNQSGVSCSDTYYFDKTPPSIIKATGEREGHHYKAYLNGSDNESGIYRYYLYMGTSSSNYELICEEKYPDGERQCNSPDLESGRTYHYKLEIVNQAGLSVTKTWTYVHYIFMEDARNKCEIMANLPYCNEGVYVKFNGYLFVLFRVDYENRVMLGVSLDAQKISLINDFCCDQGHCNVTSLASSSKSGIWSAGPHTLYSKFYTKVIGSLDPTNYLRKHPFDINVTVYNGTQIIGYKEYTKVSAYFGLMSTDEMQVVGLKPYMRSIVTSGTLISTPFMRCTSADHYICNNNPDNLMAYYSFYNGSYLAGAAYSAVMGENQQYLYDAHMVLAFRDDIKFSSGDGSYSNPYIVQL